MVLLDEVVERFTLSQLSIVREGAFFLQLFDRRRIGWILIEVDHSRKMTIPDRSAGRGYRNPAAATFPTYDYGL